MLVGLDDDVAAGLDDDVAAGLDDDELVAAEAGRAAFALTLCDSWERGEA